MNYFIWFSEHSEVDGTRIFACPIKMLPRGEVETQTQVSAEVMLILFWNTKQCSTILKYKDMGLYVPRDLNTSVKYSLSAIATFSWQLRPPFSKRQQQKLTCSYMTPSPQLKLTGSRMGTYPGPANLSSFSQGKRHQSLSSDKKLWDFSLGATSKPASCLQRKLVCKDNDVIREKRRWESPGAHGALSFTLSHLKPHNTGR